MTDIGLKIPEIRFDSLKMEEDGSPGSEKLEYRLLFHGNADLLQIQPEEENIEELVFGLESNYLKWAVKPDGRDRGEVEQEIEERLEKLNRGVEAITERLESINEAIETALEEEYDERAGKAVKNQETIDNLDVSTPDDLE